MRKVLTKTINVIDEAEDGLEAIEKVKESISKGRTYDVIFMDYLMPNTDGITAAKEIRSLGYMGQIVAVTGDTLPLGEGGGLPYGFNHIILKRAVCRSPISVGCDVNEYLVTIQDRGT